MISERQPIVTATDLAVTLGGNRVLDQVSLALRRGEVMALVGPNGAGKSTLLAALAGDISPDAGIVQLCGHDLRQLRVQQLARVRSVMLQEHRSAFAFTVRQIVLMGRSPWPAGADDQIVRAAIASVELDGFEARAFLSLSGGEKARASFARALAQETSVLFLDEPTAALDIRHQEALLSIVRERARAGAAVIVVLHDLSLAAAYADRIALLDHGRIVHEGPPAAVLRPDLLSEVYRHPIDVLSLPGRGLVVVPARIPSGVLL